ncbi:hypothetical protein UCRNP2_2738 [Neofusicoccum parvum UCRNP2]|uniref:Uncharacterized protein n=2 Tax=Neofusicoccum parvum TaxID=310453 RepID=R1GWK8_BOTPV|nr:hypothetical protein UCRNP2_2738 [Neofusicoccum parvum UCRNP2]GME47876.1 uncharacterized protein BP5553_09321 [Neofusicoccum parvum]
MDCSKSPEACNNACYYENCVEKKKITYKDSGSDDDNDDARMNSGVGVAPATAVCRTYPIVQKMWDNFPGGIGNKELDTDEWPMAQMLQDDFKQGTIRNTLRCITSGDNRSGGSQLKQFRRGEGWYGKEGKYKAERKCLDPGKVMDKGDFFTVQFDNVDPQKSPYCKPTPDCTNDGFQFHMTKLEKDGKKGKLGSPYEYDSMNHYAITGQQSDLRQYSVVVVRSGTDGEKFEVTVYSDAEQKKKVGSKSDTLKSGKTLKVDGLPEDLTVKSNGDFDEKVGFEYATSSKKYQHFEFDTNSKGRYSSTARQAYCEKKFDAKKDKKVQWTCGFPGF